MYIYLSFQIFDNISMCLVTTVDSLWGAWNCCCWFCGECRPMVGLPPFCLLCIPASWRCWLLNLLNPCPGCCIIILCLPPMYPGMSLITPGPVPIEPTKHVAHNSNSKSDLQLQGFKCDFLFKHICCTTANIHWHLIYSVKTSYLIFTKFSIHKIIGKKKSYAIKKFL